MRATFDQISNSFNSGSCRFSGTWQAVGFGRPVWWTGGPHIANQAISRTVKHALVDVLRDEIVRGDLVPGQYLRLEEVAARFDVSTMPVREALRDLEAEGVVRVFPHRGAVVTKLSPDELQDIYDMRVPLEEMATRLAVPHLTEAILAELASLVEQIENHRGDVATLVGLNHQLHTTLYAASGRRHLCEINLLLRHRSQHYLHIFTVDVDSENRPNTQEEHRAILDACRRGDAEQAAALMRDHVAHVGRAIVEYERQRNASAAGMDPAGR
jgi:DNA-binding GntR family transcriptional regulator